MSAVGQEVTSIMDALPVWGPLAGSLIINAAGIIWSSAKFTSKVERIEEKLGEKEIDLRELENRLALRMTEMEARQAKLEDFIYKEIRSVLEVVQQVKADVKGIEGYMRAQNERATTTRSTRR